MKLTNASLANRTATSVTSDSTSMKETGQSKSATNALPASSYSTTTTVFRHALQEHTLMTYSAGVSSVTATARLAAQDSNALPVTAMTRCSR